MGSSEIRLLELTEQELKMRTSEIAALKCPGFDYFLEAFIIKEMLNDMDNANPALGLQQKIDVIFHYAEYDA